MVQIWFASLLKCLTHMCLKSVQLLFFVGRIGDVQHYKILRSEQKDKYFLWNDGQKFASVNQLVTHYKSHVVTKSGPQVVLRELNLVRVATIFDSLFLIISVFLWQHGLMQHLYLIINVFFSYYKKNYYLTGCGISVKRIVR